jgi:ankyrin repeat protein
VLAVVNEDIATLRELATEASVVNALDKSIGASCLHVAAQRGNIEAVGALLSIKADVNLRDQYGGTPLLAVVSGRSQPHHDTLRMLIQHNAKVECEDQDGLTALHEASNNGDSVAVQLLIAHGAPVGHIVMIN